MYTPNSGDPVARLVITQFLTAQLLLLPRIWTMRAFTSDEPLPTNSVRLRVVPATMLLPSITKFDVEIIPSRAAAVLPRSYAPMIICPLYPLAETKLETLLFCVALVKLIVGVTPGEGRIVTVNPFVFFAHAV